MGRAMALAVARFFIAWTKEGEKMNTPECFSNYLRDDACVRIIDLDESDARQKLFESIEPTFIESTVSYEGQDSFTSLLTLAKTLRARTAVIEPYVGTDWNEEFGHLYSRTFKIIRPTACRIHFFRAVDGKALKTNDLFFIPLNDPNSVAKEYLGYTVLRPISAYRVSETMLKSPWVIDPEPGAALNDEMDLVHCQATQTISLLGNELTVRGMPFMQQDTTVGVCAQADLWMVARYANLLGQAGRYRPATITRMATRTITLGPPREGLIDLQILDALRRMGLNAILVTPKTPLEAREFIYSCVESALPVIAGIPNHVVVVIGHGSPGFQGERPTLKSTRYAR